MRKCDQFSFPDSVFLPHHCILSMNRGETEFFGSFLRKSPGPGKLSFCWPQNIEKIPTIPLRKETSHHAPRRL